MKNKTLLHDIILVAVLLIVALSLFAVQKIRATKGKFAVVRVYGQEIARYNLNKDGTYELNDGSNTIKISDGKVQMVKASCPNGLCISQGIIADDGQSIICLPNELTVTIVGGDSTADFVL